jgi:hypothetical protein
VGHLLTSTGKKTYTPITAKRIERANGRQSVGEAIVGEDRLIGATA